MFSSYYTIIASRFLALLKLFLTRASLRVSSLTAVMDRSWRTFSEILAGDL